MRECIKCHQVKPLDEFRQNDTASDGIGNVCEACYVTQKRDGAAARRAAQSPEERNAEMAAYRAGIRKTTCAVCGGAESEPLCEGCRTAIRALGGTEAALKKAAKVVRYLGEV